MLGNVLGGRMTGAANAAGVAKNAIKLATRETRMLLVCEMGWLQANDTSFKPWAAFFMGPES